MSANSFPEPVAVISERLAEAYKRPSSVPPMSERHQDAYAIIGALEQSGWVIVRKRHQRDPK